MERRTRRTRQFSLVYETLKASTAHPTAEKIFSEVRKSLPKISLGTVYRNLGVLKERGLIIEIPGPDHTMHYDANLTPHAHFICENCAAIIDVWDCRRPSCRDRDVQLEGAEIHSWSIEFKGLCPNCSRKTALSETN